MLIVYQMYCTYIYILYIYIYAVHIYIYILYIYIYIYCTYIYIYILYMHIIDNLYYIINMMFFLIYIFTILILSRPWRPSRHWWRCAESPGSPAWRCPRWWCHRGIPPRSSAALGAWRRAMDGDFPRNEAHNGGRCYRKIIRTYGEIWGKMPDKCGKIIGHSINMVCWWPWTVVTGEKKLIEVIYDLSCRSYNPIYSC